MESFLVTCGKKQYIMSKLLTVEETHQIWKRIDAHAKLNREVQDDHSLYPEYTQGEVDQWRMVMATLKKCLGLSDEEVSKMAAIDARDIFEAIVKFSRDKSEKS